MYFSLLSFARFLALGLLPRIILSQGITNATDDPTNALSESPQFDVVPPYLTGDTDAIVAITQGLSLYGLALDTKNYSALSGAFTSNVNASVAPFPITSLAQYESFLTSDLAPYKTQHVSDNVFAYDFINGTAKSISYQQAIYFGSGNLTGQVVTYYERFFDNWVKELSDGSWKIARRILTIFAVSGNLDVLGPDSVAALKKAGLAPP
ncbi:hypothetical protein G7Y79_00025g057660 [Physcia stellaris]|nr:hypothetical protein G7Y79_00025g057660 [Physcia stellaris]